MLLLSLRHGIQQQAASGVPAGGRALVWQLAPWCFTAVAQRLVPAVVGQQSWTWVEFQATSSPSIYRSIRMNVNTLLQKNMLLFMK